MPMNNPSITVDLTREVARLVIDNDLSGEGIAAVDSICFRGLSKESTLFEQEGQKVNLDSITVTLQADSSLHTFYILPVLGGQVSYTAFWKDKLGGTRLNQGHVIPKLDKNNSYRLKLSTGEIVEIGTPGDLTVTVPPLVGNYFVQDTTVPVVPDGGTFVIRARCVQDI